MPTLWTEPETTYTHAGSLCQQWTDCKPAPKVEAGPWTGDEECRNRETRCVKCGKRGRESENLTLALRTK